MDYWLSMGFNKKDAHKMAVMYKCKKKKKFIEFRNPILNLLNNYEMNSVIIGPFVFIERIGIPEKNQVQIGKIESDPVVIDFLTDKILLIDHENLSYIMGVCATSSAGFLESLARLACFRKLYPKSNNLKEEEENRVEARKIARECSKLAGEGTDVKIYYMLAGVDI
jgi:hypothetical protein